MPETGQAENSGTNFDPRPFTIPLPDRRSIPIVEPESEGRSGIFIIPLPDRQPNFREDSTHQKEVSDKTSDRLLPSIRKHLRTIFAVRHEDIVTAEDEAKISEQAPKLERLIAGLDKDTASEFLTNKYVRENLDMFVDVDPRKVQLTLQVAKQVQELAQVHGYDDQFIPALNLVGFTVLEMLRDKGFTSGAAKKSGTVENAQKSLEDILKGGFTRNWGEQALYRHATLYLSKLNPDLKGPDMERALVTEIASDLYEKLSSTTNDMSWTGQSQGTEIEVLSYINKSKNAVDRGIDLAKWLPRGIPKGAHARKDWSLLPLLGVPEDVGERSHQLFEVAPKPSESVASQTTIMFSLLAGRFISEEWLSGNKSNSAREGKEGYSLHVSTVFPKDIINEDSVREYTNMARVLAGAFATDQRISFGGFMSGGRETADKSASGNLQEVGKRKPEHPNDLPESKALVEVRNLDISLRDPYSALLQKEVLDFSFRCAWEKIAHPEKPQRPLEAFAAKQWGDFQYELHDLYRKYGIAPEQLKRKYESGGKNWEEWAWKDMAAAREANPHLKQEFADLIRKHTSAIREQRRKETQPEKLEQQRKKMMRYVVEEPLGKKDALALYVGSRERKRLGISVGDMISIKMGDKAVRVAISQGMVRGNGFVEGPEAHTLRFSQKVLETLDIPNGYSVFPRFDKQAKGFQFERAEFLESPIVRFQEPRHIVHESLERANNEFYMTYDDRKHLGLKPEDEITVRFGNLRKKVKIAYSRKREDGSIETPTSGNWRLSKNIISEFGIPESYPLRARFDKNNREFRIGPSIAQLRHITTKDGNVEITHGNGFFMQSAKQAKEYGIFMCVVDPREQNSDLLHQGLVEGYVVNQDGSLKKVRVPIPDISYDKELGTYVKGFMKNFSENIVPLEAQNIASDKWEFAKLISKSTFSAYQASTILLSENKPEETPERLRAFLVAHDKIILKPRFGSAGIGIMLIEKTGDSYEIKYTRKVDGRKMQVKESAATLEEAVKRVSSRVNGNAFVVQEKLSLAPCTTEYRNSDGTFKVRNTEMRVTIQRGIDGSPRVIGMVARLIDPELSGGEYDQDSQDVLEQVFPGKDEELTEKIHELSTSLLGVIEREAGKKVGEIAFDIGLLADGSLRIIEANSKAETRLLFKDAGNKDAEDQSTRKPIEYALNLTDMV